MPSLTAQTASQGAESFLLAAQVLLTSFILPSFSTKASSLRSLTLTSNIAPQDYQSAQLQPGNFAPESLSTLPKSITHLTLQQFSLGFPDPFLTQLAKALPHLQSLTFSSCLVHGLSGSSHHDALTFFNIIGISLKELHIVDSFARIGFWKEVGTTLSRVSTSDPETGLRVLEVSYTYRGHTGPDFQSRINGDEWPAFLTNNLTGLSLKLAPPSAEDRIQIQADKEDDQVSSSAPDGIIPFANDGGASHALRKQFEVASGFKSQAGMSLRVLNLSMFVLRSDEIGEIVYAIARTDDEERSLASLTISVLLKDNWFQNLCQGLKYARTGSGIQSLEIVGVPARANAHLLEEATEKLLVRGKDDIEQIGRVCSKLKRFEMSILKSRRIGSAIWEKSGDKWGCV